MAYFAWAPITYGAEVDEGGVIQKVNQIGLGESVEQATLGIEDEEFQYLIDAGVVREKKYPEDIDVKSANLESPNTVLSRKARAQLEGAAETELPVAQARGTKKDES